MWDCEVRELRSLTVLHDGKSTLFIEKAKFFDDFPTCNIHHLVTDTDSCQSTSPSTLKQTV